MSQFVTQLFKQTQQLIQTSQKAYPAVFGRNLLLWYTVYTSFLFIAPQDLLVLKSQR